MRPETAPLRNADMASFTCARGRVVTCEWIFPAAAMARTARRSWRVPTEDAWMRTSDAAIEIGGKQIGSAGRPTTRRIPDGRTQRNAVSYAAFAAEVTIAACTPPARRNSFATFAVVAFRVSDAPKAFACASFSSE